MDLDELRAFLKVVDEGSLARAAATLLVSRTTIRRRIEALEARLGAALFARNATGVEPTEAGRLLAARGRIIVREADFLTEALREAQGEPAGTLRVALPPGLPPFLLQPVAALWRQRYPRLSIHFRITEEPLRALLDQVDVAVVFGDVDPHGPWMVLPILSLREWIVASDAYLARRGTPRTIEDLAEHELLVWCLPGQDPARLPHLTDGPFVVQPAVVSSDVHWLRQCAMAGMGLVYLPDARLPDAFEGAVPLRPVLPDLVGRRFEATVAFSRSRNGSPQMRAVLNDLVPLVEQARAMLARLQPR